MFKRTRRLLASFRGRSECRFCGDFEPVGTLRAGVCHGCVTDTLKWLDQLGVGLVVPMGFKWGNK